MSEVPTAESSVIELARRLPELVRGVVWAAAPTIERQMLLSASSRAGPVLELLADGVRRATRDRRLFLAERGPELYAWTTENQRRAVEGLVPAECRPLRPTRTIEQRFPTSHPDADHVAAELRAAVARTSPRPSGPVARELLRAARSYAFGARLLGNPVYRALVIANQHDSVLRGLLLSAEQLGVGTVYVAHSSYYDDARYRDLPVGLALLPGPREVELYRALGASSDRLHAIGMPTVPDRLAVSPDGSRLIVALSADDHGDNAQLLHLLGAAKLDATRVLVMAHPRTTRLTMRRFREKGFEVDRARTIERVEQRGHPVLASGSGILLEAMALGVASIDLRTEDSLLRRPFLAHEAIRVARNPQDLAAQVEQLRRDPRPSATLRTWVEGWCCAVGEEAHALGRARLDEQVAATTEVALPALDRWSTPLSRV